jgi:hypothetical protein
MTSNTLPAPKSDHLAVNPLEIDFSLVLARSIDSIKSDPAQLRNVIYELARIKLQKEAWQQNPEMSILELRRLMLALETAIERVETHSSEQNELCVLRPTARLVEPIVPLPKQKSGGLNAAVLMRGGMVVILIVALCAIAGRYFAPLGANTQAAVNAVSRVIQKTDTTVERKRVRAHLLDSELQSPKVPLPSVYGIYAVSGGQLYELEALPGRVPDPRVFMSSPVKTPSRSILPDGRITFIVFRRDLVMSAPERIAVRVIAKVMRAMTFNTASTAKIATLNDQWAIRGTFFEFRVAPVSENPEMLLVEPENSDFVFPAGRYGLVVKGQAYDFSVAGPITEAVQCLERVDAANGNFYSECRTP